MSDISLLLPVAKNASSLTRYACTTRVSLVSPNVCYHRSLHELKSFAMAWTTSTSIQLRMSTLVKSSIIFIVSFFVLSVAQKVIASIYQGVTTVELDVCPQKMSFTPDLNIFLESFCRDCCISHHKAPRLCYLCSTYCRLKPSQGNQENILSCHQGPLRLW